MRQHQEDRKVEHVLALLESLVSEAPGALLNPTQPGCSTLHSSDCQGNNFPLFA